MSEVRDPNLVLMPDGQWVRFPPEMPLAERQRLIRKKFPDIGNPPVSVGEDMLKGGASGLAEGTIGALGMPGDVSSGISKGAGWVSERYLGADPKAVEQSVRSSLPFGMGAAPTSEQIQSGVTNVTGWKPYETQTPEGGYAHALGEFAPGMVFGAGGGVKQLARSAITNTILPALTSETAGQAFKGKPQEAPARAVGALVGGIAAPRVLSPFPASTAAKEAVKTLSKEGVSSLTAGQRTGSRGLKYMESELGGGKFTDLRTAQSEEFTKAALKRAGIDAPRATPEVLDGAYQKLGFDFDRLAKNNDVVLDAQSQQELLHVLDQYKDVTADTLRAPIIQNLGNELLAAFQSGAPISGTRYQALRSRLGTLAWSSSNRELSEAMRGFQSVLDDAMERTLASKGSPDLGAWKDVRRKYRNLLILSDAAAGAGPEAVQGLITPARLRQVVAGMDRRSYARGRTEFDKLARAGVQILPDMPNSGTAGRSAVRNLFLGMPAALGTAAGYGTTGGDVGGAMLGAAAGVMAPWAISRSALSKPGRAILANQRFATPLAEALAASGINATLPYRLPNQ